jgi:hypothetical protein
MLAPLTPDGRAERTLLTMARRGDVEALRGMLHRYSSTVWAACALTSTDEAQAAARFAEAWNHIFRSLVGAHRSPDLAGLLLSLCGARLGEFLPQEEVARALRSAAQIAAAGETVDAPSEAVKGVEATLAEHAARLSTETEDRRGRRQDRLVLPGAVAGAVVVGLALALWAASRPGPTDIAARSVRTELLAGDLVTRLRDCASPPFSVTERDPAEMRQYEQIGLVLEEMANTPPNVTSDQLADLRRRIEAFGLVEFACEQADRTQGDARQDLFRIALALEEIANL